MKNHRWNIDDPESGPIEKFYLLKLHGAELRKAGYRNIERLSCAELRRAISNIEELNK